MQDLSDLLDATARIVAQTRQRIAGITPDGSTRMVSPHDQQGRPIAKGRLGASCDQRKWRSHTVFHAPNSTGKSRHGEPVRYRDEMPSNARR